MRVINEWHLVTLWAWIESIRDEMEVVCLFNLEDARQHALMAKKMESWGTGKPIFRCFGGNEIIVSKRDCWKVKLPFEKHTTHCKIAWFQKGNKMLVISCCVVKFTMRDVIYDDAWWDVVPVDACHILLGRMWLDDKGMFHHNKPCTFSFYKDEKKFALQLHKEEDANPSKTTTST